MKLFAFLALVFFAQNSFAIKQAILCRKAESFDQAVAKMNAVTADPQWPIDLELERAGSVPQKITLSSKQVKYDMGNFRILESEEDIKTGKTTKKTKFYQACVPVEFD